MLRLGSWIQFFGTLGFAFWMLDVVFLVWNLDFVFLNCFGLFFAVVGGNLSGQPADQRASQRQLYYHKGA